MSVDDPRPTIPHLHRGEVPEGPADDGPQQIDRGRIAVDLDTSTGRIGHGRRSTHPADWSTMTSCKLAVTVLAAVSPICTQRDPHRVGVGHEGKHPRQHAENLSARVTVPPHGNGWWHTVFTRHKSRWSHIRIAPFSCPVITHRAIDGSVVGARGFEPLTSSVSGRYAEASELHFRI